MEKISPDSPELSLVSDQKVNKKLIKIGLLVFGSLVMVAFMIAFSPKKPKTNADGANILDGVELRQPKYLNIEESDYLAAEPELETELPPDITVPEGEVREGAEQYATYDRRSRAVVDTSAPLPSSGSPQEKKVYDGINSSIFFGGQPESVEQADKDGSPAAQGISAESAAYEAALASISNQPSDYTKQNQQEQKRDFINTNTNLGTYSTYNQNSAIRQVAPDNELWAGSTVPIVLLSSINSDLPGDIVGQVIYDVYDSYSGLNVLIPKGSRVYGRYDSNVAWGQERLIVVWTRIIRPDAISLLIGAQGAEIDGTAGIAGTVDNHGFDMVSAIALGTGFELGVDALRSVLNIPKVTETMSRDAVNAIVQKMLNQQVTIRIKSGSRSVIFINKDIIMPIFSTINRQ